MKLKVQLLRCSKKQLRRLYETRLRVKQRAERKKVAIQEEARKRKNQAQKEARRICEKTEAAKIKTLQELEVEFQELQEYFDVFF